MYNSFRLLCTTTSSFVRNASANTNLDRSLASALHAQTCLQRTKVNATQGYYINAVKFHTDRGDQAAGRAYLENVFLQRRLSSNKSNRGKEWDFDSLLTNLEDGHGSRHTTGFFSQSRKSGSPGGSYTQMEHDDLRRFLKEVGTDPKEANFWLNFFQRESDPSRLFAVLMIQPEVFDRPDMLDSMCSCLAFLHRHEVKTVLIHGRRVISGGRYLHFKRTERQQLAVQNTLLVSMLENHGARTRSLLSGSQVLMASSTSEKCEIDVDPIKWCFTSGHLPVLAAVGETEAGFSVPIDVISATEHVARVMQPMKIMFLNVDGGIHDTSNHVVPNINLPWDFERLRGKEWFGKDEIAQTQRVYGLLKELSANTSVVITSASSLLLELFTHHGSGTFFKITKPVVLHRSLDTVSKPKLLSLMQRGFGKPLTDEYFEAIEDRLEALYLSHDYSAAAVVTEEPGIPVRYLDKFISGPEVQGLGAKDDLWEHITRDYSALFWRSRICSKVNPWYFRVSDGSYNNGVWIIYWYGIQDHRITSKLIDYALKLPDTFISYSSTSDGSYNAPSSSTSSATG